jgi:flagellar assembly protein FliH
MLVAALVRMTIEKMREGSSVTVRVGAGRAKRWKDYLAGQLGVAHVEVTEDAELSDQDCVLETELGSANFGLDTQLKEVEQGFFDLLALRPESR